jgi:hypothetical protein
LLLVPEKDDRLDAEAGAQKGAWDVDVDGRQLLRRKREIEGRNVRAADVPRKKSFDEAGLDGLPVKWPRRIEALVRLAVLTDGRPNVLQDGVCESARAVPKCGLLCAEREIDAHALSLRVQRVYPMPPYSNAA